MKFTKFLISTFLASVIVSSPVKAFEGSRNSMVSNIFSATKDVVVCSAIGGAVIGIIKAQGDNKMSKSVDKLCSEAGDAVCKFCVDCVTGAFQVASVIGTCCSELSQNVYEYVANKVKSEISDEYEM